MKKSFINTVHVEGVLYEHNLELRTSGPKSKNPGTEYISGSIKVATDDEITNIVDIYYTYVTAVTATGKTNSAFTTLKNIINETAKTYMKHGKDNAALVRIDAAMNVNDFYTDRNNSGTPELVSAKRYEGGFIHIVNEICLPTDEKGLKRNNFKTDMIITNCRRVEANEEKGLRERVIVKGYIFNFAKNLMPVEFATFDEKAMNYFESLDASINNPTFTKVWGPQVSEVVKTEKEVESAFGDSYVETSTSTRKEFVITGASPEPYIWDDESTLTVNELKEMLANREIHLAEVKTRFEEYKQANSSSTPTPAAVSNLKDDFKF